MGENILEVKHMTVTLYENGEEYKVVNRISFTVGKGEIVGIVGESGCGKSMTALALQDLLKNHIKVTEGSMMFDGRDLRKVTPSERRQINGKDMTMIFQEPMTASTPSTASDGRWERSCSSTAIIPMRRSRNGLWRR